MSPALSTGNPYSLVIAATFTAEPLALPLTAWCGWLGLPIDVRFAPYNQVFQQLLDPHSLLSANRRGANLLLIRLADWCPADWFTNECSPAQDAVNASGQLAQHAEDLLHAIQRTAADPSAQLTVCFCPGPTSASPAVLQAVAACEAALAASLSELPRVQVIASSTATELYPVTEIDDPLAGHAGKIPYTQAYFTALATLLARRRYTSQRQPVKVIALDCDNTLWDGVCGEVGTHAVVISPQRRTLQLALLHLREQGYLLCLCSKNNATDAWQVFDQHPDMLLRREHITAARLNWSPKSQNLRELAQQLNVGLDSLVFIDDSPLECAEVRAHAPHVLTLQLPSLDDADASFAAASAGRVGSFLQHVWALDRSKATPEDRQRAELYAREMRRDEARLQTASLAQFLSDLNLRIDFLPMDEVNINRASQLTLRTNQFNFTTRRRTVDELRQWCAHSQQHAFLVDAADKFGQYGLVGLVLYRLAEETLQVESMLLSCRALGRQIELRMLEELSRRAQLHGCTHVEVTLIKSAKNQPAQEFLQQVLGGFRAAKADWGCESADDSSDSAVDSRGSTDGNRALFRTAIEQFDEALHAAELTASDTLPRTDARELADESADERAGKDAVPTSEDLPLSQWPWELCQHIATQLNNVDSILCKIRQEAPPRPELDAAFVPPRSSTEQAVVELCQDVLNLQSVGIHDGFNALGASSLHIVQLYSRLEQTFQAGLSITDLFALPTVGSLIEKIEHNIASVTRAISASNQTEVAAPRTQPASRVARPAAQQGSRSDIAVIGMAGRFPGAANVREFWSNITRGVCSIVDIADHDLNLPFDSPLRTNPNLVRRSASVADVDKFDAKFFGIFPKEATLMDPQHRLLLESCWHAIEDAGYNVDAIEAPVGVFAGCYMNTYMLASLALSPRWLESLANAFHDGDLLTELGNDKDYLATRVAFLLNLRGPAITVQTACSTSLVAIAQACQSLVSGQCEMALAGGSTLKLPQNRGYLYTEGGMVSPDGVCRTFDAQARGTVFGEGCGVVLLKRVEDALADGDDIYAVVTGWGLNNDGRAKMGYTAPSVEGQAGAIAMAHRAAGIEADTITLVEAHGTGTSLGDPIEIESLTRVFRQTTDKRQYCAIGSVKPNIGHLDVAAGVAGLIKASLALRHRVLPPSLNYEHPNPNIDFKASPFFVNTQLQPWQAPFPRRAGLSSFGVGGTNAHLVLEEAPQAMAIGAVTTAVVTPIGAAARQPAPQLLLLSARSAAALDQQRLDLIEHLHQHPQIDMADVAYTLQIGRKSFNYTLAAVARDRDHAMQVLRDKPAQQLFERRQVRRGKSVIFMFPGQGSQHLGMAAEIYKSDSIFRRAFDECSYLLQASLGFDLRRRVFNTQELDVSQAAHQLDQTAVAQAAIFTVSYALAKRLEAYGVIASQMIGHSVGEFVAACLAGVLSLPDALRLIAFRATHMQQLPTGSMLAVRMAEAELLDRLPSQLSLAAINGPQLCVVSGPTPVVKQFQQNLEAHDVVCRNLHTSHAFHSSMMDDVVAPFEEQLRGVSLHPPQIPIVSSVTGRILSDAQAVDPSYWARHLRETVRFTDALATVAADSDAVLLEVGPGQTLSTLARQHPNRDVEQAVLSTLPHAKQQASDREHLLLALGRLWQAGVNVDWKYAYRQQPRRRLHLPVYPFERLRYWLEPDPQEALDSPEGLNSERAVPTCEHAAAPQDAVAQPAAECSPALPRSVQQDTTQQSTTAQSTAAQSTAAQSTAAQSTAAQSTTAQSTTAQSTAAQSTTAQSTAAQSTTTQSTAAQSTDGQQNGGDNSGLDEAMQRVIQQQLQLMQQQLRAWRS